MQTPLLKELFQGSAPPTSSFLNPQGHRHEVEALIFEGGGTKGMVYAGCIIRLEKEHKLDHVKYFAGTSAGSQTATLLAVGYKGDKLKEIMAHAPWEELLDGASGHCGVCRGMARVLARKGYYKGDFLENYLEGLIQDSPAAKGRRNFTFKQLHDETGKTLRVGVCNIGAKKFEFLDYTTVPDMPLSEACRASSSIPLVFVPKVFAGCHYVDGGLQGNLPTEAFPATMNGIAFHLMNEKAFKNKEAPDDAHKEPPKTLLEYIKVVHWMLTNNAQAQSGEALEHQQQMNKKALKQGGMKVIRINTGEHGVLETSLTEPQIDDMINRGTHAVEKYLKEKDMP